MLFTGLGQSILGETVSSVWVYRSRSTASGGTQDLGHSFSRYGPPSRWIFSELASGWNPRKPAIWLVPRAGSFLRSCPLTRAESLAASFTSLFVVVNEQNRWFRTIFLLKLALLLALAREKWILLFRQTSEGRIKQVSQKTAKVKHNRRLVMSLH